jgi:exopolysaccharide biosynthesis WecB/TagA/CpsF family protein
MNLHGPIFHVHALPSYDILGTPVAMLGWDEAIALLSERVESRQFTPVSFLNAHNANIAWSDRQFARAMKSFLVLPDGIGVDIAARLLYGKAFPNNLNGTDFLPSFISAIRRPMSIGLLGSRRENAEQAAVSLTRMAPQHRVFVVHDGFFTASEEPAILEHIRAQRPDILLVAMGVPRQELWIFEHITPEHTTLPIAVGALLDFLSGAVPRAPMWMRRLRMEWIFRLMLEPRRLWRRYVVGNPVFLLRVLCQKLARRGGAA